jgi:hypothetical protein
MSETARDEDRKPEEGGGGGGDDSPTKLFAAWLQEQREGLLHGELTDALAEVSAAVIDLNKGGTVELKLKINPAGKGQRAVFVTDEVKAKPPVDKPSMMFFADGKGNLTRRDPNQTALPLKDVSRPPARDLPPRKD